MTGTNVRILADLSAAARRELIAALGLYELEIVDVPDGKPIPGSHWGEPEAGIVGRQLFVRSDTPLHSAFHESCHFVCMDEGRRKGLHTDAGGDYDEENAVCYLSVLLSDHVSEFGRTRMLLDMDAWGYSFRLGDAGTWFESDADDARTWLLDLGLINTAGEPTWRLRGGIGPG